jgi:alkaline phosphatase
MNIIKRLTFRLFLLLITLALLVTCAVKFSWVLDSTGKDNPQNAWAGNIPKYVFLFIGDGMGVEQVKATEAYLTALQRNPSLAKDARSLLEPGLLFTRFQEQGKITTHSSNKKVTDSAAAGTALSTGHKTRNGVIGMPPSKWGSLPTLAEEAKRGGRRVGIITSVSINHATPAAFYAHVSGRGKYYTIGQQLIGSGFDYFAGGGFEKADGGKQNLYELAKTKGITVLRERSAILSAEYVGKTILAVNPVLDGSNALPDAIGGVKGLGLDEFVQKGIELLDNPNGFFMMIEGGKIDWASHNNSSAKMIFEVIEFNLAVKSAVEFAKKYPEDTLIVVTSDHETGGLSRQLSAIQLGKYAKPFDVSEELGPLDSEFGKDVAELYWHTTGHSDSLISVFAYGQGSSIFSGQYDNTDIAWKLFNVMGVTPRNALHWPF